MKRVLIIVLFALLRLEVDASIFKRQADADVNPECMHAAYSLTPKEQQCFVGFESDRSNRDYSDYGSATETAFPADYQSQSGGDYDGSGGFSGNSYDFAKLCSSKMCWNAMKKILSKCKSLLPEEYKNLNFGKVFAVLCSNDSNGNPCYKQLPDDLDIEDPCQSALDAGTCNQECKQVLLKYNSSCCYSTLLSVMPKSTRSEASRLQELCGIGNSSLCTVNFEQFTSDDSDSDSNLVIIGAAAAGGVFLLMVVIVVVIIVVIVVTRKSPYRSRTRVSTNSRDVFRMKLTDNEDPDD